MSAYLKIYKASAGSGKTFTLASDYITLLLDVESGNSPAETFKHILAVTFTNKATTEMKQRILLHLYGIANNHKDSEDTFKKICANLPDVEPSELRQRAGIALKNIIHDYDRFSVTTIDSFFQTLLSNLAHELGLPPNFHVELNDAGALHKAVEILVNESETNKDEFQWLFDYIKDRIDDGKRWDVTRETEGFAKNLLRSEYLAKENQLSRLLGDNDFIVAYKDMLKSKALQAKAAIVNTAKDFDAAALPLLGDGYTLAKGGKTLKAFVDLLINGEIKEPAKTVLDMSADSDVWYFAKDKVQKKAIAEHDVLRLMKSLSRLIASIKNSTYTINSCELSSRMLNPMRLLNRINELLKAVNRENNRFLLASTPILFQKLVSKEDAPFVFEKAGIRYDHIMIDEFQDTSRLQWENFKKLIIENLSQGQSCMLVGDIKQSIYRWRGGNWEILGKIDAELRGLSYSIFPLLTNYRSEAKIIGFNNKIFKKLAESLSLYDDIYNDVEQAVTPGKQADAKGYVRVRIEDKENKGHEKLMLDDMAKQIRRLHNECGIPYNDMAILVRRNVEGAKIIAHFEEQGCNIPLVSDEAYFLSASQAVQIIIHAMKWISNPQDTIALNYLANYYTTVVAKENFEWGNSHEQLLDKLPETLVRQREALCNKPLYELTERLIELFGLNENGKQNTYLFSFLDNVLRYLDENSSDLRAFLTYWEESLQNVSVQAGSLKGIQIITIHKAKGLDFHTVLLPYHSWTLEPAPTLAPLMWCEPQGDDYGAVPLLPIKFEKKAQNSIYRDDYEKERRQMHVENLNLLYVSFTRAKANMLIWSAYKVPKEAPEIPTDMGGLLYSALFSEATNAAAEGDAPLLLYEDGTVSHKKPQVTASEDKVQARQKNPLDFNTSAQNIKVGLQAGECKVEFVQSNAALRFMEDAETGLENEDEDRDRAISRGNLLHNILSHITVKSDIEAAMKWADAEGLFDNDGIRQEARSIIENALNQDVAGEWFDGSWQVYNERTICSTSQSKDHRPDRVLVKGDRCIVIDYKFAVPRTLEYKAQVGEYMNLLRQMGFKKIEGYIWYPLRAKAERLS